MLTLGACWHREIPFACLFDAYGVSGTRASGALVLSYMIEDSVIPSVGLCELVVVETHAHSVDIFVLDNYVIGSSTLHDTVECTDICSEYLAIILIWLVDVATLFEARSVRTLSVFGYRSA